MTQAQSADGGGRLDSAEGRMQEAIERARAGQATVIDIEGDAGFGKTTSLRRILSLLDGFEIRRAFGEEGADATPYTLLDDLAGPLASPASNTFHATRLLSDAIDDMQRRGPVAFVIDDLQWVDAESVDTLATVVLRSSGARLLVVAAHRPLRASHSLWRRLVRDLPAHALALQGLDVTGVDELVRAEGSTAPEGLAAALHEHTGGNPLHVVALLHEHPPDELAAMASRGELPAPSELAARMGARIAGLSPDAGQLLSALAVLGDDWVDSATAAAVAGVSDGERAIRVLAGEGLVRVDRAGHLARLRVYHSVVRAAVYETIPTVERRRLHGAAAARHADALQRLQHRAAAAPPGSDDGLAAELAEYAARLHAQRRFRQAARLLRSAAEVARSPEEARRRLLESEIESLLGRDPDRVASNPSEFADDPRERLVAALLLAGVGEWHGAWQTLRPIDAGPLADDDPLLCFRVRCMRAWCGLYAGRPLPEVLADAEHAAAMSERDDAMSGQVWLALAHARLQEADEETAWAFTGLGVDRATLSDSPDGAANLVWRGCALALFGAGEEAVADLVLALDLIGEGTMDFADVVYYGYLGLAEFQVGRWQRASFRFDIATSSELGTRIPSNRAFAPLAAVISGDPDAARAAREESRRALVRNPYEIGIWAADIADVLSLALTGSETEKRAWSSRRIGDLGDPLERDYPGSVYLWIVGHALAASWGGDVESTRRWAEILRGRRPVVGWHAAGVALLEALGDAAAGEDTSARLAAIAEDGFGDVPVLTAVTLLEAARVASAHGGRRDADTWRTRAQTLVAQLGGKAVPSAAVPDTAPAGMPGTAPAGREEPHPLAALSEREREVAFLVKEGLSYAQIAQELYVTRSTVGFHLTNCYAKTNTRSRHELARLVRTAAASPVG